VAETGAAVYALRVLSGVADRTFFGVDLARKHFGIDCRCAGTRRRFLAENFPAIAARFSPAGQPAVLLGAVLHAAARGRDNQTRRLSFAQCRDR